MDDNTQLPVDLSSGTNNSDDGNSINDNVSTNLPDEVSDQADLPTEVEKEPAPEDTQGVPESISIGDQFIADSNVTPGLDQDATPESTETENSEEVSSDMDISKEILTDDADDSESFLDDTKSI